MSNSSGIILSPDEGGPAPAPAARSLSGASWSVASARLFERYGFPLALTIAVTAPLKLSLAYAAIFPLITLWLLSQPARLAGTKILPSLAGPLALFMLTALVCGLFGIDPVRSVVQASRFGFFLCIFPALAAAVPRNRIVPLLAALLAGQTLAALHSVVEGAFPGLVTRFFLGQVTESGQLALSVVTAFGLLFVLNEEILTDAPDRRPRWRRERLIPGLLGLAGIACFATLGLSGHAETPSAVRQIALITGPGALAAGIWLTGRELRARERTRALFTALLATGLPLLFAALLVNLKRGPWLGVLVGTVVLLCLYARRLVVPLIAVVVLLIATVDPVRERLARSSAHFFIQGGRGEIWAIGEELALRYPLGIGWDTSAFLRLFSPDIPRELVHFHSNPLNILVETGLLGLAVFGWWLWCLLRAAFRHRRPWRDQLLAATAGAAIISWQAAGLVEYSLGDSEVLLVALIVVAMLQVLESTEPPTRPISAR